MQFDHISDMQCTELRKRTGPRLREPTRAARAGGYTQHKVATGNHINLGKKCLKDSVEGRDEKNETHNFSQLRSHVHVPKSYFITALLQSCSLSAAMQIARQFSRS